MQGEEQLRLKRLFYFNINKTRQNQTTENSSFTCDKKVNFD